MGIIKIFKIVTPFNEIFKFNSKHVIIKNLKH